MSEEDLLALATGPDFEREPETAPSDAAIERSAATLEMADVISDRRGAQLARALLEQAKAQRGT